MKNKKGFTLVELLGVITILGILALIAMPTIDVIMTKNREKVYNTQIETIKNGLKTWGDGNALALPENSGEYLMINLGILKKAGFVDEDIKDPTTDACFSNDAVLTITKVGSGYSYHVDEESLKGGTSDDCEAPLDDYFILLKGSKNIELDFYESYVEPGYTVVDSTGKMLNVSATITIKDKDGNVVSSIDSTSNARNTYTITYEYNGIIVERKVVYSIIDEYVFDYTGNVQEVTLPAGKWKFEVWGAQGGTYQSYYGGAGGYSVGTITLTESKKLYVYVGGQPETNSNSETVTLGGYNGGGNGTNRNWNGTYTYGQGGGGATDIRIGEDSLYARVIVAGGGGGSASTNDLTVKYGGGVSSGSASSSYISTQIGAGSGGRFGVGGNADTVGTNYQYGSGGGGGGWYGGGASNSYADGNSIYRTYNAGGSGWVYTAANFNVWKNGNPTDANKCVLNSSYYLTSASTIAGNQYFLDPDGTTVIGHSGNGYARITRVG